jgi:ribonucleoside-triphosphate reductase
VGIACAIAAIAIGISPLVRRDINDAVLFGLYSVPSNSVIPLPHEPGLLYFSVRAAPWALAIAGAIGTFVAAFADGVVVTWAFSRPTGDAVRRSRSWRVITRLLMRAPFLVVMLTSFLGVPPIQVVRLLVLSTDYPLTRYAWAAALGRLPRFYLIALAGRALSLPGWIMGAVTLVFLAFPVLLVVRARWKHMVGAASDPVEVQPALAAEAIEAMAHVVGDDGVSEAVRP